MRSSAMLVGWPGMDCASRDIMSRGRSDAGGSSLRDSNYTSSLIDLEQAVANMPPSIVEEALREAEYDILRQWNHEIRTKKESLHRIEARVRTDMNTVGRHVTSGSAQEPFQRPILYSNAVVDACLGAGGDDAAKQSKCKKEDSCDKCEVFLRTLLEERESLQVMATRLQRRRTLLQAAGAASGSLQGQSLDESVHRLILTSIADMLAAAHVAGTQEWKKALEHLQMSPDWIAGAGAQKARWVYTQQEMFAHRESFLQGCSFGAVSLGGAEGERKLPVAVLDQELADADTALQIVLKKHRANISSAELLASTRRLRQFIEAANDQGGPLRRTVAIPACDVCVSIDTLLDPNGRVALVERETFETFLQERAAARIAAARAAKRLADLKERRKHAVDGVEKLRGRVEMLVQKTNRLRTTRVRSERNRRCLPKPARTIDPAWEMRFANATAAENEKSARLRKAISETRSRLAAFHVDTDRQQRTKEQNACQEDAIKDRSVTRSTLQRRPPPEIRKPLAKEANLGRRATNVEQGTCTSHDLPAITSIPVSLSSSLVKSCPPIGRTIVDGTTTLNPHVGTLDEERLPRFDVPDKPAADGLCLP